MKRAYPSDKQDQYMVRFPEGMRDRLKAEASSNSRSLNAEIIARLEESFTEDDTARIHSQLLDRTWEERAQMIKAINAQDQSLQALRNSHQTLVAISKQLGQLFLDNSKGQPDFLIVLAQALATFEPEIDMGPSEELPERPWEQGYPDPTYYPIGTEEPEEE